ncbi:MAG: glycoside hydrolase family 97 protein [Prevotella sp.]|nr:glycoside hydrolase family 97 protein [Prevotella sp.]
MKRQQRLSLFLLSVLLPLCSYGKDYQLQSPNGKLQVVVSADKTLAWKISKNGTDVLAPSAISLTVEAGGRRTTLGKDLKCKAGRVEQVDRIVSSPFYRKAEIRDQYNRLIVTVGEMKVEFRAYDQGAAYRFLGNGKKQFDVVDETAEFRFTGDYMAYIPYERYRHDNQPFCYSFESYYTEHRLSEVKSEPAATQPVVVALPDGKKVLLMESGVENYPGLWLTRGEAENSLKAVFPKAVLGEKIVERNLIPTRRADEIAIGLETKSNLPWRIVAVSEADKELLDCDLAWLLSPECRIKDTSWIKPGKVAWDWWNNCNLKHVDFISGMNTPTYKYFIDFAAKYGLEYIIIDEGWSGTESLTEGLNPAIDVPELVSYGRERGVGVMLWSTGRNCLKDMERTFAYYEQLGVKGFKVDFFDRDDQQCVQSTWQIAECAARHHLLLDFHGYRALGMNRTYPNVLNQEGVMGMENMKWEGRDANGPVNDVPHYDVLIPYLRMQAGPMDYTPGAMLNATKSNYIGNNANPMSQGTRAHQVAMYIVFEAPLQMLSDSPSKYYDNPETTEYIAQIPTVFDETIALDGALGEYVVLARRKGSTWYVGAMNNWTARDVTLDLSALKAEGRQAMVFADGINAHRDATDYKLSAQNLPSTVKIHLAPGGGWAAVVK